MCIAAIVAKARTKFFLILNNDNGLEKTLENNIAA